MSITSYIVGTMPKKSNKLLKEENQQLREQVALLSASKKTEDDARSVVSSTNSDNASTTIVKSDKSSRSPPPSAVSSVASNSSNKITRRLNTLEDMVSKLCAKMDLEINNSVKNTYDTAINNDNVVKLVSGGAVAPKLLQNEPSQYYYTPQVSHYASPSVLTTTTKPTKVGSISSEMSKETVSQNWSSIAATANAVTKRFNEDTGLLIAPLDYKELSSYVINSFDIISVARKLITIKRYINNKPLKLLDIIAFIDEDLKQFVLAAYHQHLIQSRVPKASLYEEHELLAYLRESNDLGALVRAVAVNLEAKEPADYLLVMERVRFWKRDYEAIVWSYQDAAILVNWMFGLVKEIVQLGILQFDDFEAVVTAQALFKIVLGTMKTPLNPLTAFITKLEQTSKRRYTHHTLLAAIDDIHKSITEYCRTEESSGYYQFVKATNKFALKIYFRQNYGKNRPELTHGNFSTSKFSGADNKLPSKRPWQSSPPASRAPMLAALDVSADPYDYFDEVDDPEDDDDAVSDDEEVVPGDTESNNLLAALSGADKARLPCFAHFRSQRIKTDAGSFIDVSDPKGCERGTSCQYSHDTRDTEIVSKFTAAITKRLVQKSH